MTVQKRKLCLCMIVKNEAKVIARCLMSMKDQIDYWVIVDTGSTDETALEIERTLEGIPGQLIRSSWKHFGPSRTEAFEVAFQSLVTNKLAGMKSGDADAIKQTLEQMTEATRWYAVVLDADEIAVGTIPDDLTEACYGIWMGMGGTRYKQLRLFQLVHRWRYEGVLHEFPTCGKPWGDFMVESFTVTTLRDGARSNDPEKFQRDAKVFEDAIAIMEAAPADIQAKEQALKSRYVFYLAQSYRDALDSPRALLYYLRRAEMGIGFNWEEIYVSLIEAARAYWRMGLIADCEYTMFRAYKHWPERSEAPRYLAELFAAKTAAAEANPVGGLFLEQPSAKPATIVREPNFKPIGLRSLASIALQPSTSHPKNMTLALLVKDKAHLLGEFLTCIERQSWPKFKTSLYIRTNNNNDRTREILAAWVDRVRNQYLEVHFDDSNVEQKVERFGQHEWNQERFSVLGAIRQASVDWARDREDYYAVVDCDNMISPHTLEALMNVVTSTTPIVAPLLHSQQGGGMYSNYHADIDSNGYYLESPIYETLLHRKAAGLIEVPVVHCTYIIHPTALSTVSYNDGSGRYEYVIFSDAARKAGVPQYLDTREVYGHISFAETREQFTKEPWLSLYSSYTSDEVAVAYDRQDEDEVRALEATQ